MMKIRRNWFYTLAMFILIAVLFLAMVFTMNRIGDGQEYPYLLKGEWIIGILLLAFVLVITAKLYARLRAAAFFLAHPKAAAVLEWGLAVCLLAVGFAIRLQYVRSMPMEPESDYKTYYEVAQLIENGTLLTDGPGYCDYIAVFPHVYGYPYVLSLLFHFTGASVMAALYFNVVLAVGTVFFCWRTARLIAGRKAGLAALAIADFWPSMILYNNFVASEYLFTFLLMVCIWLFAIVMKNTAFKKRHAFARFWELALLGFLIAVTGAVRPMAQLFLFAVILVLLMTRPVLRDKPAEDVPLGTRAVDRGWKMVLILLLFYLLFSKLFSASVAYAIDEQPAGGSASFGYNLLVGLNQESYGGWNQEDADYMYAALDQNGLAEEAQLACRDLALQRLKTDPRSLLNLFIHKFEVLWGNDDYGSSWNILFMDQQGNLTPEREAFYYSMMDWGDLYYLTMLAITLLCAIYCWKEGPGAVFPIQLMVLATVALHLLVENQNRYHYHVLALIAVMAGAALARVFEVEDGRVMAGLHAKEAQRQQKKAAERRIAAQLEEESRLQEMRAKALHAQFDMEKAIREGHITITASEAVKKAAEEGEYQSQEDMKDPFDGQKAADHEKSGQEREKKV
ncbi:MAG: glycosyltransferase family 39 protein [Lachnospiraceae bacterium]